MHIYAILINGEERYIGVTKNPIELRWRQHRSAARCNYRYPLYRAMNEAGLENCCIKKIASAMSHQDMLDLEIDLIIERKTHLSVGGLNVSWGGDSGNTSEAMPKGEDVYCSKLTDEFVRFTRDPEINETTNDELVAIAATEFNIHVSRDCIRDARRGSSWKHVSVPPVKCVQGSRRSKRGRISAANTLTLPHVRQASALATSKRLKGNPAVKNCKLSPCQVWDIFYGPEGCQRMAKKHKTTKKCVLDIRHKRILQYRLDVDGVL